MKEKIVGEERETDKHFHFHGEIAFFSVVSQASNTRFLWQDYDENEGGEIMTISTLRQLVP
jgi:hypothetical protein